MLLKKINLDIVFIRWFCCTETSALAYVKTMLITNFVIGSFVSGVFFWGGGGLKISVLFLFECVGFFFFYINYIFVNCCCIEHVQ